MTTDEPFPETDALFLEYEIDKQIGESLEARAPAARETLRAIKALRDLSVKKGLSTGAQASLEALEAEEDTAKRILKDRTNFKARKAREQREYRKVVLEQEGAALLQELSKQEGSAFAWMNAEWQASFEAKRKADGLPKSPKSYLED